MKGKGVQPSGQRTLAERLPAKVDLWECPSTIAGRTTILAISAISMNAVVTDEAQGQWIVVSAWIVREKGFKAGRDRTSHRGNSAHRFRVRNARSGFQCC
jgi:hypothetical protein